MFSSSISDQEKRALRARMREARSERAHDAAETQALCERMAAWLATRPERPVAGVWPLPGEPDLTPVWRRLHEGGYPVLLPETTPIGRPLVFRKWHPGIAMCDGRFGTQHPDGPVARPELVLVPLLAFDRGLRRLGYGGGYYDRTLADLRCVAVGFAFAWQEVAEVPVGDYDWELDGVITDREVILKANGKV